MEMRFKKNVRIICDLNIGDTVRTDGWGYRLDDKDWVIEDVKYHAGGCESGFLVKINGYENYIDSSWLNKVA